MNGTGSLEFRPPHSAISRMEDSWQELRMDPTQWEHYISSHIAKDPDEVIERFLDVQPKATIYSLFAYDAVMAIGLGACKAIAQQKNETTAMTGQQHLQGIRSVDFRGISGRVKFGNTKHSPGSRVGSSVYNGIINLLPPHGSDRYVSNIHFALYFDFSTFSCNSLNDHLCLGKISAKSFFGCPIFSIPTPVNG